METMSSSDSSNYSNSENDDWIPTAVIQSVLDEDIPDINFND